ncbi:MAG TPA: ABC transporter substrate-binding protein [Methanospirillum sp.]|nr:ABC transporter substrate-binding protein [Methanospirillum sp.]
MTKSRLSGIRFTIFLILSVLIVPGVLADESKSLECGVILPLSGDFGELGNQVLQGIEYAVDEVNSQGGAGGYQINLTVADDTGDPDLASRKFSEMNEKGIPVVIGSLTTNLTLPMAEKTINNDDIVLISPRANGNALYGISPRFYQVQSPVMFMGGVVATWLSWTSSKSALVFINDSYGQSFKDDIILNLANSASTKIVAEIPLTREDPGYSQTVQKILDSNADTVVLIGCDSGAADFLKSLSKAGFTGKISLTESCLMNRVTEELTNETLGTFMTVAVQCYSPLEPGYSGKMFISDYEKKYQTDPTFSYAGYGYDSVMLIKEAILHAELSGNVTASSLQKGLKGQRYAGVTGPKVFDEKNTISPLYNEYLYTNGTFVLMTQANLYDMLHELVKVVKS